MSGPLAGRTVVELAGIGPAPFAGMLLADMGADVIRVDRPGGADLPAAALELDLLNRGKRSVVVDLKRPDGVAAVLALLFVTSLAATRSSPQLDQITPDATPSPPPSTSSGRSYGAANAAITSAARPKLSAVNTLEPMWQCTPTSSAESPRRMRSIAARASPLARLNPNFESSCPVAT